jgi:hypothetical protein
MNANRKGKSVPIFVIPGEETEWKGADVVLIVFPDEDLSPD